MVAESDRRAHRSGPVDKSNFRVIAACSLGNALEVFDFTVFSFFAVLLGKLFFPSDTPYGSLLLAVATFGIGFLTRPLGGVLIGGYADRRGRKAALMLTIALMVLGTLCIGLAPTYAAAGALGPAVIIVGRLLQGFSLGGEIGASTAMLMEAGGVRGRGMRVGWQLATQGAAALMGGLTGAALYAGLSPSALESWGWRLPFLFGLLIGPVGLYIRARLPETHQPAARGRGPFNELLTQYRGLVVKGIFATTAGTATMYLVVFYMPTYMIKVLGLSPSLSLVTGCVTGSVLFVASLAAGRLADRLPRRKPLVMASLVLSVLAVGPAFWMFVHYPSVALVLALSALLTLVVNIGTTPLFLMMLEMLPGHVRASGIAVVYSAGVTIFGGSSQFIVTWLLATTSNAMAPAYYMMGCGVVSALALLSVREKNPESA